VSWHRERLIYEGETDRLVECVTNAADPTKDSFIPYRGERISEAVLFTKLMVRKARMLGLYEDMCSGSRW
jgi:hypothetical protein